MFEIRKFATKIFFLKRFGLRKGTVSPWSTERVTAAHIHEANIRVCLWGSPGEHNLQSTRATDSNADGSSGREENVIQIGLIKKAAKLMSSKCMFSRR